MRLLIFRSLWTNGFNLDAALADCRGGLFDGVEGPAPDALGARGEFLQKLQGSGVPFIAEIMTGGGYVPEPAYASPADQLGELCRKFDAAADCAPLFTTVLAGCDFWSVAQSVEFFGTAIEAAAERDLVASFETHRSRPTYNPWVTGELLRQLPQLLLTCDFSHWCCVCERLVLDFEPELLALCATRAHHIHARIGHAQGPQVPHPGAPEFRLELKAHERWWQAIRAMHSAQGRSATTMTPEFGPDGYLACAPFTRTPVADLDEINHWMAARLRKQIATAST
jgi:hypothetical protein